MYRAAAAAALLLLASAFGPAAASAAPISAACTFVGGFATLHDLVPDVVGDCIEDEHHDSTGDALQATTNGLLVWRQADNWTAFTDGSTTWINGPEGLQSRPNDQRFAWEQPQQGPQAVARQPKPGAGPQPVAGGTSGTDGPSGSPSPSGPPAAPNEGPFTFTGHETTNTLPFGLNGGAYAAAWHSFNNQGNCIMFLESAEGGGIAGGIVNDIFDGERKGQNALYNVPPGVYFVSVIGCGDWAVSVAG